MKYVIYGIFVKGSLEWRISSNIEIDRIYWYEHDIRYLIKLSAQMSIGHALSVVACIEKRLKSNHHRLYQWFTNDWGEPSQDKSMVVKRLKMIEDCFSKGESLQSSIQFLPTKSGFLQNMNQYRFWREQVQILTGKQLLLHEVNSFFADLKLEIKQEKLNDLIQIGYLLGDIVLNSGISYPNLRSKEKLICNRCGSTEHLHIQNCSKCNERCATCEDCIQLGRSKTCEPMFYFRFIKNSETGRTFSSSLQGLSLNIFQTDVADAIVDFLEKKVKREMLVWAVTSAGKTEMIFPAIHHALHRHLRILIASPRKDVIKELIPRIQQSFPNTPIVRLYGGSKDKWNHGSVYVATTHQVVRFVDFFDIAFIDELDAFPFHNNPTLEYAVHRSLTLQAQLIYLTATPSNKLIRYMNQRKIESAILPIRYHMKSLPVPLLKITPKKGKLLSQNKPFFMIEQFIMTVKEKEGQAFIFLSEVKEVTKWTDKLKYWFPHESIEGVFAKDEHRDIKVERFRKRSIRFLVTTTIMERGVTIPNVHVLVIGADAKIFDETSLVQIAGRVGRSPAYSNGEVWFLSEVMTEEMVKARKQIKRMNKLAEKMLKTDSI